MCEILALVLSLSIAQGKEKPITPEVQYKELVKEFGAAANANWRATNDDERKRAAARIEPLPLKLLELAEKNSNEKWTLDALTQIVTCEYWLDNYSSHSGWGVDSPQARAIRVIQRDYIRSDQLGETCKRVQYGFRKECETFLRTVIEKNPHTDIKGQASLRLAGFLQGRLNRLDLLKDQPDLTKRYEGIYGKDYLDGLRRQDRAKATSEVVAAFEQAVAKYGDVKLPYGGTVGEDAKTELFTIRHLSVGKDVPEIEGVDQDGARFKLSNYRGKVVLLYFWQQI